MQPWRQLHNFDFHVMFHFFYFFSVIAKIKEIQFLLDLKFLEAINT